MHITIEIQLAYRLVNHGHAAGAMAHIVWHVFAVSVLRQQAFVQIRVDGIAQHLMHMLEIFTPRQFINKFMLRAHAVHTVHVVGHIGNAQNTVRQIRRQHADRAMHMVSTLRIFKWPDRVQPLLGGVGVGLE